MAHVTVDLNKTVKPMKPMHGGGQPPIGGVGLTTYFHYMTEAGIPFSRLHDVGGVFGGNRFVDIPNIENYTVIVDAIFGTGLDSAPKGLAEDAIVAINTADAPILAVDIPSGVSSDTGECP